MILQTKKKKAKAKFHIVEYVVGFYKIDKVSLTP